MQPESLALQVRALNAITAAARRTVSFVSFAWRRIARRPLTSGRHSLVLSQPHVTQIPSRSPQLTQSGPGWSRRLGRGWAVSQSLE
jgi:hypothetical protein